MHCDVDRCGTAVTESTPDSELLTVLSAEAARVAGEEGQSRKLARDRSYAGAADLNKGRMDTFPKMTRRRSSCTSSSFNYNGQAGLSALLLGESFCLEQTRAAAPSRSASFWPVEE